MNTNTVAPIIRGENLARYYHRGTEVVKAVDGVDITISPGQSLCICGASGSGKTTLINLLAALDVPSSGKLFIHEREVTGLRENQLVAVRRGVIGYVFQKFHLIPTLTAYENVALPLMFLQQKQVPAQIEAVLDRVGLLDRRHHRPAELSGGQMQRVAVARALMANPRVLIADEPTGNLDRQTGDDLMDLFLQLVAEEQISLVLTTHNQALAQRCDRIITMEDGKLRS